MKKLISVTMAACMMALTLTACGGSNGAESKNNKELEKVTFVLDWTPNTNHTG